jgi:hypothetical protein
MISLGKTQKFGNESGGAKGGFGAALMNDFFFDRRVFLAANA